MISELYTNEMEQVVIETAEMILHSRDEYSDDDIIIGVTNRDEEFNFSQVKIITARVSTLIKLKELFKDNEIKGRITSRKTLKEFCEKFNFDVYTVSMFMDIMFGEEKKFEKGNGKVIAFIA